MTTHYKLMPRSFRAVRGRTWAILLLLLLLLLSLASLLALLLTVVFALGMEIISPG